MYLRRTHKTGERVSSNRLRQHPFRNEIKHTTKQRQHNSFKPLEIMNYSVFVVHARATHHLPNWDDTTVLASCKNKGTRKATEAAYIATNDTINTRVGFIKWAKSAALFSMRNVRDVGNVKKQKT